MKRFLKPDGCILNVVRAEPDPRVWLWFKLGPKLFREFQRKFGGRKFGVAKSGTQVPCSYCSHRPLCFRMSFNKHRDVRRVAKKFNLSIKHAYALLKKFH